MLVHFHGLNFGFACIVQTLHFHHHMSSLKKLLSFISFVLVFDFLLCWQCLSWCNICSRGLCYLCSHFDFHFPLWWFPNTWIFRLFQASFWLIFVFCFFHWSLISVRFWSFSLCPINLFSFSPIYFRTFLLLHPVNSYSYCHYYLVSLRSYVWVLFFPNSYR